MNWYCLDRTQMRPVRAIDAYSVPKAFGGDILHVTD
jgi:hypothetical protein